MKNFTIETMTNKDYNAMMNGSNNYNVTRVTIKAETEKEALEKAKKEFEKWEA